MGYNKEIWRRVRGEYAEKSLRAEEAADARRAELQLAIPELREYDKKLSDVGLRVMKIALDQGDTKAGIEKLHQEQAKLAAAKAKLLKANGYAEDYAEPKYECEKCRDTGYIGIKMCECMRRRLLECEMESSGLSGLFRKQSFETFSLDFFRNDPATYAIMERNLQNAKLYAEHFSMQKGYSMPTSLLFLGGTGLGKTHLSTAIAKTVMEKGYDVFYNSAVGMISDFEFRRFGNGVASVDADDTARYTECDLLIIDDLGTEVVNQFTLSCLYHVLNTRLNLQKPTIISTNLSKNELQKTYSDRIVSRLFGEYQLFLFSGTDVRKQKM